MARKRTKLPKSAGDYIVGYGRPPADKRFKPGQSGNPGGRPKGSVDFRTLIAAELNKKVTVIEDGRRRKISKGEASAKQLANQAASGDLRATRLIHDMMKPRGAQPQDVARPTTTEEPAPQPQDPQVDISTMTTEEMKKVYEAALILEGHRRAPPPLMPPGDPEEEPT